MTTELWAGPRTDRLTDITRAGFTFFAGTGLLSPTATDFVNVLFSNPAGSGERDFIYELAIASTATATLDVFINPTTGLPTTTRSNGNARLGSSTTSSATFKSDVAGSALSGGTQASSTIMVPAGTRQVIELPPIIVSAGVSVGLTLDPTGNTSVTMTAFWWKEI